MKIFTTNVDSITKGVKVENFTNSRQATYPVAKFSSLFINLATDLQDQVVIENADFIETKKGTKLLVPEKVTSNKALVFVGPVDHWGGLYTKATIEPCPNRKQLVSNHQTSCFYCNQHLVDLEEFPQIARSVPILNPEAMFRKYHTDKGNVFSTTAPLSLDEPVNGIKILVGRYQQTYFYKCWNLLLEMDADSVFYHDGYKVEWNGEELISEQWKG